MTSQLPPTPPSASPPPVAPPPLPPEELAEPPKYYTFSVLLTGIARFFRAFVPFVVVIVVNAAIQAGLVYPDYTPGGTIGFIAACIVSFVVLLVSFGLLNAAALAAATPGWVSLRTAISGLKAHFWLFALWSIIELVAVMAGLMIYTLPGLLILAITPFVTLAAMDGKKLALVANFRAIGSRFARYVVTVLITGFILIIAGLLTAADGFFIGGWLGSIIGWVYWGLFASWVLVAFATLYRSTHVGAPPKPLVASGIPQAPPVQ